MAPMPEPMPVATAMRPSAGSRSSTRASNDPKPALICPVGPSRPPDPPEPMVSAEATILTRTARKRTPRRVVVHGRDGGIGAVAFGLRSEPVDEESAPSSAPTPAMSGRAQGRAADAEAWRSTLTRRGGYAVAGQDAQEEVRAEVRAS
jgi:hypothetical protein